MVLDSLKRIGQISEEEGLTRHAKPVFRKKGKEQYIIKLIFNFDQKRILAEPIKYSDELAREYRWIGHTQRAAREPVERLTIRDIKYVREHEKNVIHNIRRKIVQLKKRGISKDIERLDDILADIEGTFIKSEKFGEDVDNAIKEVADKALIYTICIQRDDRVIELAKTKGYDEFLEIVIKSPLSTKRGLCHVCGEETEVMPDPSFDSASLLKVYVVDKKGFTSGISGSDEARLKTFAVCRDCRHHIRLGWLYVKNRLSTTNVKGLKTYLIPRTMVPNQIQHLDNWSKGIREAYDAVSSFDGLMRFENLLREKEAWYSLSVVFAKGSGGSHFDLKSIIQEVPLTRLSELRERMNSIERYATHMFGGDQRNFSVGFNDIAGIFPLVADRNGRPREYRPILELFYCLLSGLFYPKEKLVAAAILFARIHRYKSYIGFNIRQPEEDFENGERDMCLGILKYNLLINILADMGVLERSESLLSPSDDLSNQLPNQIKDWFEKMGYDGVRQALFLLGYLVGEVGIAQYKKGDYKKSILDKIDFYGMSYERVIELAVRVLKSLRDYRRLSYNEALYHIMKAMLDRHLEELKRRPLDNVFYILSGYAFRTYQAIIRRGEE